MSRANKPSEELGYTAAAQELETILDQLERGSTDIDTLTLRVERAAQLIKHCRTTLRGTELRVAKVLEALTQDERAADPQEQA